MFRSLLVLFVTLPFAAAQDKKEPKKDEFKLSAEEKAVIELTNAERKKKELGELKMNPQLMEAARAHAANMAKQDKLDHKLDEKEPVDRTKAAGYKSAFVGENVAWNQKSPAQVVDGWMKSEGHRENILRPEYTEIGVAVARNKKGQPYWVQVFGKP
jgi:uncharacterized protein YkwD